MCLNKLTDEVYIFNLKKREDRLEHIRRQLKRIDCKNYNIVESIDGSQIEDTFGMKHGMFGLISTYLKMSEMVSKSNSDIIIVIEDDCVFSQNFCQKFDDFLDEVPDDWKLLYFGGNHNTHMNYEQPIQVSENVMKLVNTYTAHCVVFRKEVFEEFISELKEYKIENDVLLSQYQRKYSSYSTTEKITWQINNHSDIENKYINYDWLLKK